MTRPVVGEIVQLRRHVDNVHSQFHVGELLTVVLDEVPDWHDALVVQREDGTSDMVWPEELDSVAVTW